MTNKIVAVQGNHPSKLNPITDTSVFDFSMIDPNTAASIMSAGFFIVIIPGLIVLGASLLLNMLNSV